MSAQNGKTLLQILTRMAALMGVEYDTNNTSVRANWLAYLNEAIAGFQDKHQLDYLKIRHDLPMQAKQRYYPLPASLDGGSSYIQFVQYKFGNTWKGMTEGISSALYAQFDSDHLDPDTGLPDPITGPYGMNWQRISYDGSLHMEIWPVPPADQNALTLEHTVRIWAMKTLPELTADTDIFEPDARLIMYPAMAAIWNKRGEMEQYNYWEAKGVTVAKLLGVGESNREPIVIGEVTDDEQGRPMRGYRSMIVE